MEAAEMDFMKTYEELQSRKFPIGETLDFSVALGENPDIALHFELYCCCSALRENRMFLCAKSPQKLWEISGEKDSD